MAGRLVGGPPKLRRPYRGGGLGVATNFFRFPPWGPAHLVRRGGGSPRGIWGAVHPSFDPPPVLTEMGKKKIRPGRFGLGGGMDPVAEPLAVREIKKVSRGYSPAWFSPPPFPHRGGTSSKEATPHTLHLRIVGGPGGGGAIVAKTTKRERFSKSCRRDTGFFTFPKQGPAPFIRKAKRTVDAAKHGMPGKRIRIREPWETAVACGGSFVLGKPRDKGICVRFKTLRCEHGAAGRGTEQSGSQGFFPNSGILRGGNWLERRIATRRSV